MPLKPPILSVLSVVELLAEEGESLFDCACRNMMIEALLEAEGCQKQAARALGLSPRATHYWVHKWKLVPERASKKEPAQG